MKNYPLLSLNNHKPWIAWNKTYLREINHNIQSLWDYNNYFTPDYVQKNLVVTSGDSPYVDVTQLDYNEYFRATEDMNVALGSQITPTLLGAGFLIVSKARNEGSTDYVTKLDNYFIQPFGYASFYTYGYNNNGELIASYDQFAEESYGLKYSFSLFNLYPRFLLTQTQIAHGKAWNLLAFLSHADEKRAICTQGGMIWTDIKQLKPMFFHFIVPDTDDFGTAYGEEIVIDSNNLYSIIIDEISIAQYTETVLERDNENIWPDNIVMRAI